VRLTTRSATRTVYGLVQWFQDRQVPLAHWSSVPLNASRPLFHEDPLWSFVVYSSSSSTDILMKAATDVNDMSEKK